MSGFFQDQFSKPWNMILKLFSRKSWNENRMLIFFKIGRLGLEEKDRKEQFLHYSSCAWCTYSAILPLPVYDNLEEDISLFPSDSNLLFQLSKYFLNLFWESFQECFWKCLRYQIRESVEPCLKICQLILFLKILNG